MKNDTKSLELAKNLNELLQCFNDIQKLHRLYNSMQYDLMRLHIKDITIKYPGEAFFWNLAHPFIPKTPYEIFYAADQFLKCHGITVLTRIAAER